MTTRRSLRNGDNCIAQRRTCVACLIAMAIALGLGTPAGANPRYDAWQAQHPYVLTAYVTHPIEGGGELDLDYFLGSGLRSGQHIHSQFLRH